MRKPSRDTGWDVGPLVHAGVGLQHQPAGGGSGMAWSRELKKSIETLDQLKAFTAVPPKEERRLAQIVARHPMKLTRYYAELIDWDDPDDPLKRMAVPNLDELNAEGSYDTGGERAATKMPGLQHKYAATALILCTNRCALYCRYCFRKRLVGLSTGEIMARFSDAVAYIQDHEEINNVLISGGDSLILPTRMIDAFLKKLSKVGHLRFIRFGSRVPVTFPMRILSDPGLLRVFRKYSRKDRRVYVTTHFNHPREITKQAVDAVSRLMASGVVVNNQTVLLRGVNDEPDTMAELQNTLAGIAVNPYYVFQCRPVKRVRHGFQVPLVRAYEIVEQAKRKLNGLSKRFRFVMSHRLGKIEILGLTGDEMLFKYHEALHSKDQGRVFTRRIDPEAGWLDDMA